MTEAQVKVEIDSIEKVVDKVQKEIQDARDDIKKLKLKGTDLKKKQRCIETEITDVCVRLDDVKVKSLDPYYGQLKRILYGRLDTLESRANNLDKRAATTLLEKDEKNQVMEEIETLLEEMKENIHAELKKAGSQKVDQKELQSARTLWGQQIKYLSDQMELVQSNKAELKELVPRKRVAYAQLEILWEEIKKSKVFTDGPNNMVPQKGSAKPSAPAAPEEVKVELQLNELEKNVNKLEGEIWSSKELLKTNKRGADVTKIRNLHHHYINEISADLDDVKVKNLANPKLSQMKRLLYARLDTLEQRLTTIDKRITVMLQNDSSAAKLADIELLADEMEEEIKEECQKYTMKKLSADDAKRKAKQFKDQIRYLTNMIEDVSVKKEELKELVPRKRIAYAKLELLMTEIQQGLLS
eukprot:Platyproteum_vivax@DN6788_c0_g1_i1.p1